MYSISYLNSLFRLLYNTGGKNSADRSLLLDLLYWVSRNPPPAHLFLISGDRDFAGILHRLRMNNYNILLASLDNAPGVLCSAASIMWHWNSMIRGEDLIGKLYNQPPDGPHGSWYGHYRGLLEDPFAVPEQSPLLKNEGSPTLEPSSELKVRPVPRVVMRTINNILREYPDGISITELREELKKSNLILDRDLYGYKKFSRFLSSMPHILQLQFQHDGQYLVRPASAKRNGPSDLTGDLSSGFSMDSGEVDWRTNPNTKVEGEERSSFKDDRAKPESGIVTEVSIGKVKQQTSTDRDWVKLSKAVDMAPPQPDKKFFEGVNTQANEENLSPTQQQDESMPQVGFFRRIWRRWFEATDSGDPNKKSETLGNSVDHSVERKGEKKVAKVVSKDVGLVNSESSSLPSKELSVKEEVSVDSDRRGLFHRIASWCKFQGKGATSKPEPAIDGSTEEALDEKSDCLARDDIFSQETFWNDVKSFLDSSRGSDIVSQSRTRAALARNMRKGGPAILETLSETDLLRLIDLVISEKKLVEENTSQVFPFRLSQPRSQGSKGLRSIFSDKTSEHEGERKVHNISHTGVSSPVLNKKPPDRSRNQLLADVQKLVQEVLVRHPEGYNITCFRKLFLEKYGYPLDLQKLGYLKITGLLQVIPGVSLESGLMFPSSRAKQGSSPVTSTGIQSVASSDGDSSDSWDELGPLTKESSGGRTKLPKYESALLDEEEVTSGSEDETSLAGQGGGRHKKQRDMDEDSSLMQILNSWYSKDVGSGNTKDLKPEEAGCPDLSSDSSELYEQRQRQKKAYSFVADTNGSGEREKQIESILGSMKNMESEQRMQQQT
ncbi:hypothetical protein CRG98_020986 [Punica granatum]|uniref:HTH OST-type domain-containing protein n=1 Tax=Punica granatum TaxID=22663 RepID=A0A2I0JQL9_PUNGR|nr:hypothetical protein CRG98_020986 [Punica granatum]